MSGAVIFGIIIIVLLLAAAITFLILWLTNKNKKNNQKKELSISGVKFILNSSTSLTATWDAVGNSNDRVTLYADTKPINLDPEGKPEGSTTVLSSNTVSGTSRTVTLDTLKENTKYNISLVVTNPDFVGANPTPDTVYTGGTIPATNFIIQEFNNIGAISLDVNDPTKVTYQTGINKSDLNDIWSYDTTNFTISTRGVGSNSTAPRPTLYNNNGVLAAKDADSLKGNANSQWTYNVNGHNRWCLKSGTLCMNLPDPTVNGSPITLIPSSTTKFINIPTDI